MLKLLLDTFFFLGGAGVYFWAQHLAQGHAGDSVSELCIEEHHYRSVMMH